MICTIENSVPEPVEGTEKTTSSTTAENSVPEPVEGTEFN
jgi:hypothetical protein